jgi:hypothetical protein
VTVFTRSTIQVLGFEKHLFVERGGRKSKVWLARQFHSGIQGRIGVWTKIPFEANTVSSKI